MKFKFLILVNIFLSISCTSLILNHGFKEYSSGIVKDEKNKSLNNYQKDLIYLDDICKNGFPGRETVFPDKERIRVFDSLLVLLEGMENDDNKFNGYLRYYLSHYHNQHTYIEGLKSNIAYPYLLYPYKNTWYLWDINKGYDYSLIGKKVVSLNNKSIESTERILMKYVSAENEICGKHYIKNLFRRADLLYQFGITNQVDSVKLGFEEDKYVWVHSITRKEELNYFLGKNRVKPHPVTKYNNRHYNVDIYQRENYAYFQFNKCFDLVDNRESMEGYLKPWIVPVANMYMNRQVKRKNAEKLRGFVDVENPVFGKYLNEVFLSIQNSGVENLVIDLRNNIGGSTLLCLQLMYHLTERTDIRDFSKYYYLSKVNKQVDAEGYSTFVKKHETEFGLLPVGDSLYAYGFGNCDSLIFEKIESPESPYFIDKTRPVFKGKIIILANHGTNSAAALFATLMQDNDLAVVIGTNVANNPIGATSYQPFVLPYSKLKGSIATNYLERPQKEYGMYFTPDFWVEKSVEDMINGNDKLLKKAFDIFQN